MLKMLAARTRCQFLHAGLRKHRRCLRLQGVLEAGLLCATAVAASHAEIKTLQIQHEGSFSGSCDFKQAGEQWREMRSDFASTDA